MKELIEVFYAPGKVFDAVRERRKWVLATLANALLIAFTVWFTYQTIGAESIARHQFDNSKFAANMTDDQKEQAIAAAGSPTREGIAIAAAAVIGFVIFVIFGLLFMAIAAVAGHSIKFPQAAGAASYAAWPFSVVVLLLSVVVVLMAADKSALDPQHLLAFNVGAFLDAHSTPKPLFALASALDVFRLGQVVFASYALSRVALITFGKALAGNIAIWVIFTIFAMAFSLIF